MTTKNKKSANEVQTDSSPLAKTSTAYWSHRVKVPAGRVHYGVQVAHRGHRQYFGLETAEKQAAAVRARTIYLDIVSLGWDAAIAKHRPMAEKKKKFATVGALIEAAMRLSSARKATLEGYGKALRRIAADVAKISDGSKFDPTGGSKEWRAKVDAVPLDKLTPSAVLAFKNTWLKSATTPEERGSRAVSFNSTLRNSKALISRKLRPFIEDELTLPPVLWFEGISREKEPSLRYCSQIDVEAIVGAASKDLAIDQPETFKALLLCLLCGLRRSEADALLWEQLDFDAATLDIRDTEHKALKSADSAGKIRLDAELVSVLRGFHAKRDKNSPFVLQTPLGSHSSFKRNESFAYRCNVTFGKLAAWLRKQGVPGLRPIHTLRKEVGSVIASRDGIFLASRFLRHADIRITSRLYADAKTLPAAGLGALLTPTAGNVIQGEFHAESVTTPEKETGAQAAQASPMFTVETPKP